MDLRLKPDNALIQKFDESAMANCKPVNTPSGNALITHVRLEDFFPEYGYGELYRDSGYEECLPLLGISENELLVDFFVDDSAPGMSWTWFLRSLRIKDRGYIFLWAEPDIEAGEPVLGLWEPFDDQQAFEACFKAVYRHHVDPILVAPQLTLGPRVANALMAAALWEGLQGEHAELLLHFLDHNATDPSQYSRDMLNQFVKRATGG